jgi:hypothetical protein
MSRIEQIKEAVERAAECPAKHVESVKVLEGFRDQIMWEGEVEVFALEGHPKAKRAYGWQSGDRFIAVLEIPPVNSANTAVRAAIASKART